MADISQGATAHSAKRARTDSNGGAAEEGAPKAKIALITGITGQDGSYLAEFLLDKGYEVHGIIRRSSSFNTYRIENIYKGEWGRVGGYVAGPWPWPWPWCGRRRST